MASFAFMSVFCGFIFSSFLAFSGFIYWHFLALCGFIFFHFLPFVALFAFILCLLLLHFLSWSIFLPTPVPRNAKKTSSFGGFGLLAMPKLVKKRRVFAFFEWSAFQKLEKHMGFAIFWHPSFQKRLKTRCFLQVLKRLMPKKYKNPYVFALFDWSAFQKLQKDMGFAIFWH